MAKIEQVRFRVSTEEGELLKRLMQRKNKEQVSDLMRHLIKKELKKEKYIKELEYTIFKLQEFVDILRQ